MPFGFLKSKNETNFKSRLERKLVVARETPEPIFDLSECNLNAVPSGIYQLCLVFRKEALLLQSNVLSSLSGGGRLQDLVNLKTLDLSCNKFVKLPENLGNLIHLEELNVRHNQLNEIPESIGMLKKLRKLDISQNKLTFLPDSLCHCGNLELVNLQENPNLNSLPSGLSSLPRLKSLLVDQRISHLVRDVSDASARFINSEEQMQSGNEELKDGCSRDAYESESFIFQEQLKLYEQRKEGLQRERMALEKNLADESRKELQLHFEQKKDKQKLMEDIKQMQSGLDSEIYRVHQQKDVDRGRLIQECLSGEYSANEKVLALLERAKSNRDRLAEQTEMEEQMEHQLLYDIYSKSHQVEQSAVVDAMNLLLQEELNRTRLWQKHANERITTTKSWISTDTELASKLSDLATNSRNSAQELKAAILADEELQKAAVAALLEQSDSRTWDLANQVAAVEKQLADLTMLELTRRKLDMEDQIVEMSVNRVALTEHLMLLLEQQQARRGELVNALRRMEAARSGEEFWLAQYERLVNTASKQIMDAVKNVDADLTRELGLFGLTHYLPLIADLVSPSADKVAGISDGDLLKAGVSSQDDRHLLLKAFSCYLEANSPHSPTAPPLDVAGASAPPFSPSMDDIPKLHLVSEECVVCFEEKVEAIFVPCGHLCCCRNCADLSVCPLCRSPINRTIYPRQVSLLDS